MEVENLSWLDVAFMEKVLREAEKEESIRISKITVKPATAKGDNYLSDIQRVTIEFWRNGKEQEITETRSVIVKIQPADGPVQKMISNLRIFDTEISMMMETLPRLNKILAVLNVPSLNARCLYVQNKNPAYLIIEDIAPQGFRMAINSQQGLDLGHYLFIVRKLGAFHASTVALAEKDLEAVRIYKRRAFSKEQSSEAVRVFYERSARTLAQQAMKWPELDPRIADKVLRLSENIFEKGCEAVRFRDDDFNVLNHGDFWINNMMFRYDEQQNPIDMKFVDFQFSYYGSPAVDILYFMGIITTEDVRMNHRDSLLREYHESLTGVMEKLGCVTKAPSLEDLQGIMEERIVMEFVSCFGIMPLILVDRNQVSDLKDVLGPDGKYENRNYEGEAIRKLMTKILTSYDAMGLLDL